MANRRKKVVIAYASAGAGHAKATFAVESAFRHINRSDVDVKVINTLDYSTPFLRKCYPAVYLFLVNKIPTIWGLGYYLADARLVYRTLIGPARRLNHFLNCGKLVNFLKDYNPDLAINTHFIGVEVMGNMRRRGMLKNTKLISVVTDYLMHSFWIDKSMDYYCVAQEESKEHLIKRGIPPEKIKVFGIPVDRVFAVKKDKKELCKAIGLKEGLRTVLITSGGYGVGPVRELVLELVKIKEEIQLVVVCGRNPTLHTEISEMAKSLDKPVKAYGFVDNMDELMEVSDVMVAKSGGMTSSEAMAKDLPVVITSAIPGQEARNCRFLVKSGAAVFASDLRKAKEAIARILSSERRMQEMVERIKRIKKPNSSLDIANFVLSLF